MKLFPVLLASLLIAGCSHYPVISDASEPPGTSDKGNVVPLDKSIADAGEVFLVLIHGVGDHCPGYALKQDGWINNEVARKHGLVPGDGTNDDAADIPDDEFIPGKGHDAVSRVSYRKTEYRYGRDGKKITVIEITWSQLTQWVKTQQLGYDTTTSSAPQSDGFDDCIYSIPPNSTFESSKSPPSRAWISRTVKEDVLNRKLADAVLYAGDYGMAIQRGVAEALCRALGGDAHSKEQPDGQLCVWPAPATAVPENARFVFITHSLGSRALYDTLLGLTGDVVNPRNEVFSREGDDNEVQRSRDIACRIIGHTSAIYMMANQLAMLGLAYDVPYHISDEGSQPYDATETIPKRGCGEHTVGTDEAAALAPLDSTRALPVVGTFSEIWRRAGEESVSRGSPALSIVSFNDTNDLLTWPVPRWYVRPAADGLVGVRITNVHVRNGIAWFGLLEWPGTAHSGYFTNDTVWSIITCGASEGQLSACP